MAGKEYIWGLGRRKTSVARVRLAPGTGQILVNKRKIEEYFPVERLQKLAQEAPGSHRGRSAFRRLGQSRRRRHHWPGRRLRAGHRPRAGQGRPTTEAALRRHGLMTRDSRMVERKKYGLRKARRGCQFSKR
jgi:small subunit ribosomal protein S9